MLPLVREWLMAGEQSLLRRALQGLKYYKINIIFPTICISTIYADWSHTQEWKKKQAILQ
jgi:hypothetical protein